MKARIEFWHGRRNTGPLHWKPRVILTDVPECEHGTTHKTREDAYLCGRELEDRLFKARVTRVTTASDLTRV